MIDRTYLPYKSAREYIDRGMAKWMGFFISEHSTSLFQKKREISFPNNMNEEEKLLLLTQAFLYKFPIFLSTSLREEAYFGIIKELTHEKLYLKTEDNTLLSLPLSLILSLSIAEISE